MPYNRVSIYTKVHTMKKPQTQRLDYKKLMIEAIIATVFSFCLSRSTELIIQLSF